jgi:hypothetical protein
VRVQCKDGFLSVQSTMHGQGHVTANSLIRESSNQRPSAAVRVGSARVL